MPGVVLTGTVWLASCLWAWGKALEGLQPQGGRAGGQPEQDSRHSGETFNGKRKAPYMHMHIYIYTYPPIYIYSHRYTYTP